MDFRGGFRGRFNGGRGGSRGRGGVNSLGCGHGPSHRNYDAYSNLPPEQIEPCKVFIANLPYNATNVDVIYHFSSIVDIVHANIIVDHTTGKSRCFGFITVSKPEDVKILLDSSVYMSGRKIVVKPAKLRTPAGPTTPVPGDSNYLHEPLSEREFDLSPVDESKPSIHILVDDVLVKILNYLGVKERIKCERVCRRWQSLVYDGFRSFSNLWVRESSLIPLLVDAPLTRPKVAKILKLCGSNVKTIFMLSVHDSVASCFFRMAAQLCPNLESFTIACKCESDHLAELTTGCPLLTTLEIKLPSDWASRLEVNRFLENHLQLKELQLHACDSDYQIGNLPSSVMKIAISNNKWQGIKDGNLTTIADSCPHLEFLEIHSFSSSLLTGHSIRNSSLYTNCSLTNIQMQELTYLSHKCPSLQCLSCSISLEIDIDFTDFKSLKSLKVCHCNSSVFDFTKLGREIPTLESLVISWERFAGPKLVQPTDFSTFENVQLMQLRHSSLKCKELITLAKCSKLEKFLFLAAENYEFEETADDVSQTMLEIIQNCPKLTTVKCNIWFITKSFVTELDKVMFGRNVKIMIKGRINFPYKDDDEHRLQFNRINIELKQFNGFDDEDISDYSASDYDSEECDEWEDMFGGSDYDDFYGDYDDDDDDFYGEVDYDDVHPDFMNHVDMDDALELMGMIGGHFEFMGLYDGYNDFDDD